ncbi:protein of unknown function [bacterium A37T11]|nr:protein of unknown function [bacterium A37T11]
MNKYLRTSLLALMAVPAFAQEKAKPEDTEIYEPVPPVVSALPGQIPSDAVVLFDGKNLDKWASSSDPSKAAAWPIADGAFTVDKKFGGISTKQKFEDYQLHLEFKIPEGIHGEGQGRGNSGVFLASTGPGDEGYELQVLDSYNNKTYVNGQVGSIYKQAVPLANPSRPNGEWQVYDVLWTAPRFEADGTLKSPAKVTVFLNGVVVQYDFVLKGLTQYIGQPTYKAHGASPIRLQAHGDKSEPISFRNIWVRPL